MIKIISSIADIPKEHWDLFVPTHSPFLKYEFFHALEKSASIGPGSGWSPLYLVESEGIFISFVKSHSYGEYIFDWSWARAYEQNSLDYYPKLTSMIPFTSVTTHHFVMRELKSKVVTRLLEAHKKLYQQYNLSSTHAVYYCRRDSNL